VRRDLNSETNKEVSKSPHHSPPCERLRLLAAYSTSRSYCTQCDRLLAWWCHRSVCLFVRLSVTLCTVAKRYIIQ